MIISYLKTAARTLRKNKGYALLNLVGLVVGISFSCMLYMYVDNELSYDTMHEKSERMFRVLTIDSRDPQNVRRYGVTVPALGPELVHQYPEVAEMVRLHKFVGQVVFEIDGANFQERNWFTADSNFFEVFDFVFVEGDKRTALKEPNSLVMTASIAKKYFGDGPAVGEVIERTSFGAVTVTGVVADPPGNSHLKFDFLFSQVVDSERWKKFLGRWDAFESYTYLVLNDPGGVHSLRAKMPALVNRELAEFDGDLAVDFQAVEDIYLKSAGVEEGAESEHGEMSYIYIFSSMGIFLLLIACINYINLATSKAMMRSREVGVRKVVGARPGQLVAQFLTESFLLTFLSAVIAVFVMDLFFPFFNDITGKSFDISIERPGDFLPAMLIVAVVIGLISGSYPAFYLARLRPVSSLKGREVSGTANAALRQVLVVFQFVVTIVMIVSTIVIGKQMDFVRTKDVGFNKDRLMVIDINSGDVRSRFQAIRNEFASIPGVEHAAVSSRVPGEWKNIAELHVSSPASSPGRPDSTKTYFMGFDEAMMETYGLSLHSGRYFIPGVNDSLSILLNESAVEALGIPRAVGATVIISNGGVKVATTVIGVLNDFNFQSLHQRVAPIIIGSWNNPFQSIDYFTLKLSGTNGELIPAITRVHEKFDQRTPIEYHFLDEQLENFYTAEKRAGMIFRMGGALSILVACLGLFGLATYNISRRTRELGIRKVLGAGGGSLFLLLSSSLLKQVAIAFVIAVPFAWYVMKRWLEAFEYRIDLHAGIFLASGLLAMLIAVITISYRTISAVRANPVESLRQE